MMFCRPVSRRYQAESLPEETGNLERPTAVDSSKQREAHSFEHLININQHIITSCFRWCMLCHKTRVSPGAPCCWCICSFCSSVFDVQGAWLHWRLHWFQSLDGEHLRISESSRARGCFPFFGPFWLSFIILSSVHTVDITSVSSFFQTFRSRTGPRCMTPRCSKPRPNPISTRKA